MCILGSEKEKGVCDYWVVRERERERKVCVAVCDWFVCVCVCVGACQ